MSEREEMDASVSVSRVVETWSADKVRDAWVALGRRARLGSVRWARVYDVPCLVVSLLIYRYAMSVCLQQ